MKQIAILILSCLMFSGLTAQDKHFSQFYAAPLTMNPALTGAFDGKYRLGVVYRDQWRGALDNPFITFAAGLDLRFDIGQKRSFRDAVAGGILFFTDRVNGLDFNTNQMAMSFAYHKALDRRSTQYLSAGMKFGFTQRNVSYEQFTFQDQFDGVTGYGLPTGEDLPTNNFSYMDMAAGVYYTVTPAKRTSYYAGAAIHHFSTPNASFYREEGIVEPEFIKINGHFGARFPISDRTQILPRAMVSLQGPHLELDLGTNFRLAINDYDDVALHLGTWVRPVKYDNGMNVDAVIVLTGIEYSSFLLGLSYDVNMNGLANYSKLQGAFEISLTYLGEYESETVICPTF